MAPRVFPSILLCALVLATSAAADCYADYKAKQDSPLRLHYGVMELPAAACGSRDAATREIDRRLGRAGWQLLNVMSIFGADGLDQRKASAGGYFLKY
ncbi:hypothetical protein [Rhodovulum sp. P5]|uniref:hypothetical protein n=1 Tax=Rhodovulum sp. P5 TaxID=1564506 RepID=UPI0009D94426|nr:hypothetical protein [Rhodovulum sp. P5]